MSDTSNEFEAAFREFSGTEAEPDKAPPAAEETPSEAAPAEPDDAGADLPPAESPQTANQEIWANATPEQLAAYEAAERRAKELEHRQKSEDGRVARYQRDRDAMQRKLETLVSAAQKDGEDLRVLVASEDWQKAKSDYGDDLAPLFNLVEKLTDHSAASSERWQQLDTETIDTIETDNFVMLDERAPDWRDLLGRNDFPAWLQSQPKPWQDAFALNSERLVDPTSALELVSRFRVHVALKEMPADPTPQMQQDPRRSRQLDGARTATSRTPVVADAGGGDFDAEFDRFAKAREKARR